MSVPDPVLERLRVADPAPQGAKAPDAIWSSAVLLDEIDVRSEAGTEPVPLPRRWRSGVVIAAAAFVAVLVVGLSLMLMMRSREDIPPAEQPSTTTTSTQPVTTTEPLPITTAAVAAVTGPVADPLDGPAQLQTAFNAQDLTGIQGLFAEAALITVLGTDAGGLDAYIGFLWQMNATKEFSNCRLRSEDDAGASVSCSQRWSTDVFRAADLEWTGTVILTVRDGFITSLVDTLVVPSQLEAWSEFQGGLEDYIANNYPDDYARTIRNEEQIFSAEAAQVYLDHYEEYLNTLN